MASLNWGIIAPGSIARAFATALQSIESANEYSVASRSLERAQSFAKEFGFDHAYGDFHAMLMDDSLDAVYIASPHQAHAEHAIACLRAGKVVLCEKPIAVNTGEAQRIFATAENSQQFCMEAVWTRFLPIYKTVQQWLQAGEIGEVKRVEFTFGLDRQFEPEHRLFNPELAGGSILDLGIYPVTLADWVYDSAPISIQASGKLASTKVDEHMQATLDYGRGRVAKLGSSLTTGTSHAGFICGTKGHIELHHPAHGCEAATLVKDDVNDSARTVKLPHAVNGYVFEIEEAQRCIANGQLQSDELPWATSIRVIQVLDELRSQLGVSYPFEV